MSLNLKLLRKIYNFEATFCLPVQTYMKYCLVSKDTKKYNKDNKDLKV